MASLNVAFQGVRPDPHYASVDLAQRFEGIELQEEDSQETRLSYVRMFAVLYDALERTGDADHTGDWDFHVGVKLRDGRENSHIGDGADVMIRPDNQAIVIMSRTPEEDEEDDLSDFRIDDESSSLWTLPISMLSKLTFGWCS